MKVIKVSATEARNNFFELLNEVIYGDKEVRVYKNKQPAVRIVGDKKAKVDWDEYKKKVKAARGIFTKEDEEVIEKIRKEFDERIDNNQW